MNTSQEFVEKVNNIRRRLPHRSQTRIAKELGKSYSYVTKVLRGEMYSAEVLELAIKILKDREEIDNRIAEQINQL